MQRLLHGGNLAGKMRNCDLSLFRVALGLFPNFVSRYEKPCGMTYNSVPFTVTTYNQQYNGKQHIGTAYPDWE